MDVIKLLQQALVARKKLLNGFGGGFVAISGKKHFEGYIDDGVITVTWPFMQLLKLACEQECNRACHGRELESFQGLPLRVGESGKITELCNAYYTFGSLSGPRALVGC